MILQHVIYHVMFKLFTMPQSGHFFYHMEYIKEYFESLALISKGVQDNYYTATPTLSSTYASTA